LKFYICKLNYFDVLCNISFNEHLSEDGHTRRRKNVGGYALYYTINLRVCVWIVGRLFHSELSMHDHESFTKVVFFFFFVFFHFKTDFL